MQDHLPARAIWALGITQIIGYGTLYYSFGVLAPEIGREFGWSPEWVYGALTVALLAGGLLAPVAGHLADRFGAAQTMAFGSVATAIALVAAAFSSNGPAYATALVAMEVASGAVLYATAFAAIVQAGSQNAQKRITHLTLIAGFASTLFWPLTGFLLSVMDWQAVYLVFAGLNLAVCAPLHCWLSQLPRHDRAHAAPAQHEGTTPTPLAGTLAGPNRSTGFGLMMFGFAIEGFILSAVLMQIIPLLHGLGLGAGTLLVTSLFGPAQVLSRLFFLSRNFLPTRMAIIAAMLLPLGALALVLTAPSLPGAVLFAILFGFGSGLISIVSGSLPLQLMGRDKYGAKLGWLSSARQIASAVAPFCLALLMSTFGVTGGLWAVVGLGVVSMATFAALALLPRRTDGSSSRQEPIASV
jgi:MFS family permease